MNKNKQVTYQPTPYYFLEIPSNITPGKSSELDKIDAKLLTGTLKYNITANSPIYIGSGAIELSDTLSSLDLKEVDKERVISDITRKNGTPIIPGSSFRGTIRSIVEYITGYNSEPGKQNQSSNRSKTNDTFRKDYNSEYKKTEPDFVSMLFGSTKQIGKVRFFDNLLMPKDINKLKVLKLPQLYGPNIKPSGQQKFYYHHKEIASGNKQVVVCDKDSVFSGEIRFLNIHQEELGCLLWSLGLYEKEPFKLKIGGYKPAGLGSVAVNLIGINIVKPVLERLGEWEISENNQVNATAAKEYIENFLKYNEKNQLAMKDFIKHSNEERQPPTFSQG